MTAENPMSIDHFKNTAEMALDEVNPVAVPLGEPHALTRTHSVERADGVEAGVGDEGGVGATHATGDGPYVNLHRQWRHVPERIPAQQGFHLGEHGLRAHAASIRVTQP